MRTTILNLKRKLFYFYMLELQMVCRSSHGDEEDATSLRWQPTITGMPQHPGLNSTY